MSVLKKVEVYPVPNGGHEKDPERAIAWHLTKLGRDVNGRDLDFSTMLNVVKHRELVRELFNELDAVLSTPPPASLPRTMSASEYIASERKRSSL